MPKYTNSEGMEIEVDESHLQAAVELKLELQKASFGSRCNWVTHKRMMQESGFLDSDSNESYRCMIKTYQKDTDQLRTVISHADLIADNKLLAIRNAVGELKSTAIIVREDNLVKSQLDRNLTYKVMSVEEFRNLCLDEMDINIPHYCYQPRLVDGGNVLAVGLADWHIGALIDCYNNIYNLQIAKSRIEKLINEIIDYAKLFNVKTIKLYILGDIIEQFTMRKTQARECEFGTSRQTVEARKLLFRIIVALTEHFNVDVYGCKGNHDRMEGDKSSAYEDDHAIYTIMYNTEDLCKEAGIKRVNFYHGNNDYQFFTDEINQVKLRAQHGDDDSINDSLKVEKYNGIDNEQYDVIMFGHLHHYDVRQGNGNTLTIYCSGLIGTNDYSRYKIKSSSNAGQTLVLFRKDGQVVPINVDLQEKFK